VIDLGQVFSLVSDSTLKWLLPRTSRLTSLDMSWCGNYGAVSPQMLASLLQHLGSQLLTLRLENCHVATRLVLETFSSSCPSLQELSLANCSLLKTTDFQSLGQLERLQSLNLYRTSINQPSLISILCSNRRLEHLSLASCANISADEVCLVLGHCQQNLKSLDLWRVSSLTARGVSSLSAGCRLLSDLDLGWCLNVSASTGALVSLIEVCRGLQRLYLTAHRQTGDRELLGLARHPAIQQLDILGNRNVSLGALQQLLAESQTLRFIDISFCEQLGESNIAQLRSQYPEVEIKWSFTDAG